MIFISLRLIERSSSENTSPLRPPRLSFLVNHRRKLETPVHTNDKKRISKSRFVRVDRGGHVDPTTIQNRRSKRTYDYYTTPMISHCIRIYQIDEDLLDRRRNRDLSTRSSPSVLLFHAPNATLNPPFCEEYCEPCLNLLNIFKEEC